MTSLTSQPANQSTSQLTFLVGPTATGKSALALQLAKVLHADILSADSRQVYQNLEVISGADIQPSFTLVETQLIASLQTTDGINIFGLSMIKPDEEWSIGLFREYAKTVIDVTIKCGKNLIIVGGSGLYLQSLFLEEEQISITPNLKLREQLSVLSLTELQNYFEQNYPNFKSQLNNSDWNNPRRLTRYCELLATGQSINKDEVHSFTELKISPTTELSWVGLEIEKTELENRIKQRVKQRMNNGAIQEVETLLAKNLDRKLPVFTTTGIKEVILFLEEKIDKEQLIDLWTRRELQYAKRQITWFKKYSDITWFDATNNELLNKVLKTLNQGH